MTEKWLIMHFYMVSLCDLDLWLLQLKIYITDLQLIHFILTNYDKDLMKNGREIAERIWRERRKNKKGKKTTRQQKGRHTLMT